MDSRPPRATGEIVDPGRPVGAADAVELGESLELSASREQAWALLADLGSHAQWNPLVRSVTGTLEEHATLELVDRRGQRRILMVTSMCPPAELCLYWHHPAPGALAVEHIIELDAMPGETCRLTQRRIYRGAFAGRLRAVRTAGAARLREMNEAVRDVLGSRGS